MEAVENGVDVNQLNRDVFVREIFCYIYDRFEIDYVVHDGKKYYTCDSKWETREVDVGNEHDPLRTCDGYWDCDFDDEYNPIECEYVMKACDRNVHDDLQYHELFETLFSGGQYIYNLGANSIDNISGFNEDHRGSDHMNITLLFEDHIDIDDVVSADELVKIAFRIKSHKFDKWYELYHDAAINNGRLEVQFDHGS